MLEYRGRKVTLPELPGTPQEPVMLVIPEDAAYLDVNPLEDEDELQGEQDVSGRQELRFYDRRMRYIGAQYLENLTITDRLMRRLAGVLARQY